MDYCNRCNWKCCGRRVANDFRAANRLKRRAESEEKVRAAEHRRDDVLQWDERVVALASEIISILSNMRMTAIQHRHVTTAGGQRADSWPTERKLEQDLKDASSRQDNLLAELRLVAPLLYPIAHEFCEKSDEVFFGVWEDVTGEGDFAMTDWRSVNEIPDMIDVFASAVNSTLRLPTLLSPVDGESDVGGGAV